jgi:hypothetical protein
LNLTAFSHNRCTLSTLGSSYSLSNLCCSSFATFPLYTFEKRKKNVKVTCQNISTKG